MMYNTGNPVGSTAPKDLYDNAQVFDKLVVGTDPMVTDRLGSERLSWAGMEYDFDTAQEGREASFQAFLAASAFTFVGDYGPGLNFTNRSQYTIRDGVPYRLAPSTTLPYVTTGNWGTEQANFTPISSDDILRQDLSASDGASLVGYGDSTVAATLDDLVQGSFGVNVRHFGATGLGVADDTAAIQAAYDSLPSGQGTIYFPAGVYNYTLLNFDSAVGLHLVGEGAISTTVLRCTSTSAADGVKFRSTFDCTASFITFDHSSASFAGWLVDTRHKPASLIDTQGLYFFRCTFSSEGYNKYSAKGVNLDQSTLVTFEGCKFLSLLRPVDGQNPAGGGYSNGIRFKNCQSYDNVGYFANYVGEQWTFQDCNFQACRDGAQRIVFTQATTPWQALTFINCGVYDALAANSSYLMLGPGTGLSIMGGMWGGRSDLGSSTLLNATGVVGGISIKGSRFSLFTNLLVAGVAGNTGWDISGGNVFVNVANYISGASNVDGLSFDLNAPNVSRGTLPSSSGASSIRYNQDGSVDMTGVVASVAAGSGVPVTFPTAFPVACWDVQLTLQAPAATTNVVSLSGSPANTGFTVFISGTGLSSVRWRAVGK